MRFFFFVICFCILSLPGFGKEGNGQNPDEQDVIELESRQIERRDQVDQIEEMANQVAKIPFNAVEELQKLGYKTVEEINLWDSKVIAILQRSLSENDFRNQAPEIQRAIIMGHIKGQPLEQLFLRFPKALEFTAAMFSDKEVVPSMLGLFNRREDLKVYGMIVVVLFISSFVVKKILISRDASRFQKFLTRLLVNISVSIGSFMIFYEMFSDEVGPALKFVKLYFQ